MLLISYDISDTKIRSSFSRFLSKFGYRLQYSLFRIENSERILKNIKKEIENRYVNKFSQTDSIMIFDLPNGCDKILYGYAKNEDSDVFIV